jgi:hypothetical protein
MPDPMVIALSIAATASSTERILWRSRAWIIIELRSQCR